MVVIGIPLGVAAASNSGRWVDHLVRTLYLSGCATPTYLGGVVAAIAIGPALGLPSTGTFSSNPTFAQPLHFSVLDALFAGNLGATLEVDVRYREATAQIAKFEREARDA